MERDFEEIEEQETTTPRAHDRGEISGKPLNVSHPDEVTSEPLIGTDAVAPRPSDIPPKD
jgi:hypothetical protein